MESNQFIYQEKNSTVEIERIFTGTKSIKELLLELLKKRYETTGRDLL